MIPIVVTVYFVYWTLSLLENFTQSILLLILPDGYYVTGMGTVALIFIAFMIGLALSEMHTEKLFRCAERKLCRIPIVKSVYGISKDFMDYFARQKSKQEFGQVVSINFKEIGIKMVGFVTLEDMAEQSEVLDRQDNILVYLPMGYQIGGYSVVVDRSRVEVLDMEFEDAMRFVLTAGVSKQESEPLAVAS